MKKFLSLLAALTLLLCSLSPALGEDSAAAVSITRSEFCAAFDTICAQLTGYNMTWEKSSGGVFGSINLNPMLILSGEQVSMATIMINISSEKDFQTYSDLFILLSTMVAAVPAVRDGMAVTEAADAVYPELQHLMSVIGSAQTDKTNTARVGGADATFRFTTDANGGVILTLFMSYHVTK